MQATCAGKVLLIFYSYFINCNLDDKVILAPDTSKEN